LIAIHSAGIAHDATNDPVQEFLKSYGAMPLQIPQQTLTRLDVENTVYLGDSFKNFGKSFTKSGVQLLGLPRRASFKNAKGS
jgi:hypothetical protein